MANEKLTKLAKISESHRRIAMSSKAIGPMSQITVRIPMSSREGLEEIARQVRFETGEECRMADIVRLSIEKFLDEELDS